ncbi:hypothetical protein [Aquabacterium sp. OR-4]|uniref:hypothetical protein n=1 Tax=Aquabacterium sp. OR-4 TaxID=2978127 RepID=UPI0021B1E754|nr:hypothetical protein [Aquabacterium sp. OR-4]MDT7834972.1 hypothetical protein [Aquabacterium sp. OR-4]
MTRAPRAPNPTIFGSDQDRTASSPIIRRAVAEIRKRFAGLQAEVLAVFRGIRVLGANDALDAARTVYALGPQEAAAVSLALQQALDRWLLDGRAAADVFWWSAYEDDAARLGTAQTVANLSKLSSSYAAARRLEEVVFSQPYRTRVAVAQVRSLDHWTGLAAGAKSELSQIIGRAVVDGKNPRAVEKELVERLGVRRSDAFRYAQTDIPGTLREAKWAEADHAEEAMGLRMGLLWTSALIATTRPWHASRAGKVYTTTEVRKFYGERGNRYGCFCGQTECLIGEDGKPMLSDALKSTLAKSRQRWVLEHGPK